MRDEALQRQRLRRMKQVPLLLLGLMAAVFVATYVALPSAAVWTGYVRAFAEAAMVGALADWFAVTALFRYPLGLRIPHTAVIPNRKDEIGEKLAGFVRRHFLTPELVAQRIEGMDVTARISQWAVDHGDQVSEALARTLRWLLNALSDDQIQSLLDRGVLKALREQTAAPALASLIRLLMENRHHQSVLTEGIKLAIVGLQDNRDKIRERVKQESPWWIPGFIDDRILSEVLTRIEAQLYAMAMDESHPTRQQFDEACRDLIEQLRQPGETQEMVERIKNDILDHPTVAGYAAELWDGVRRRLLAQSEDAGSPIRRFLDGATQRLAQELLDNDELRSLVNTWLVDTAAFIVARNGDEIAALISETVKAWDTAETTDRIELQVGRDLQFIRINGTLVGGLVGLIIHAVVHAFGG